MNEELFKTRFFKFIDTLQKNQFQNTAIVMDNAHYHSVFVNTSPTIISRKYEIIKWLHESNICQDQHDNKNELLTIVRMVNPMRSTR
jgi:hypothetical protein